MSGPPLPVFEVDERRFTGDSQQDPKCVAVEGNLVIPEGSEPGEYTLILKDNQKAESETADFFVGDGTSTRPFEKLYWENANSTIEFRWQGDSTLRIIVPDNLDAGIEIPLLAIHKGIMIAYSEISLRGGPTTQSPIASIPTQSSTMSEFSLEWMIANRGKFVHWKQVATARLVSKALREMDGQRLNYPRPQEQSRNEKLRVLYIGPDDTLNLVTTVQTIQSMGAEIGALHIAQSFTGQDDLSSARSSLRGLFDGVIHDHEHAGSGSEHSWKPDNERKKFDLIVDTYAMPWSPMPRETELKIRLDALRTAKREQNISSRQEREMSRSTEITNRINSFSEHHRIEQEKLLKFTKNILDYNAPFLTDRENTKLQSILLRIQVPNLPTESLLELLDFLTKLIEILEILDQDSPGHNFELLINEIYYKIESLNDLSDNLARAHAEAGRLSHLKKSDLERIVFDGQLILVAPRDFEKVPFGVDTLTEDDYEELTKLNKELPKVIQTRSTVRGELSSHEQNGSELCRAYRLSPKTSKLDTETRITEPSQDTVLKHGENPYKSLVRVYTGGRQLPSSPVSSKEMISQLTLFFGTAGKKCLIVRGEGRSGKTAITADALCQQIRDLRLPPTTWVSTGEDLAREMPSSSDLIVIDDAQKCVESNPPIEISSKLSEWSSDCPSFILIVNDEGIGDDVDKWKRELENSGFATTDLDIQKEIIAIDEDFIRNSFLTIVESHPTTEEVTCLQGFCVLSDKEETFFSILQHVKEKDLTGLDRSMFIQNLSANSSKTLRALQHLGLGISAGGGIGAN